MLASRFSRGFTSVRSASPLTNEEMRRVAPSIFADDKHESRSERYAYIPTNVLLDELRKEGFQPFMAAQSRVRDEGKREHAKHLIRLRHASKITAEHADEIVLTNSHDGSSGFQMLAGQFVFLCANGLVSGHAQNDVRIRHTGNIRDEVLEGAFRVLKDFDTIAEQREGMKSVTLKEGERRAFAMGALQLRYGGADENAPLNAPIAETQLLMPRRREEQKSDLWTTFNVVQENAIRGGLRGRTATGGRVKTREITGIDQDMKLNRALWVLAEEIRKLKA